MFSPVLREHLRIIHNATIMLHLDLILEVLNLHLWPVANMRCLLLILSLSALPAQNLTLCLTSRLNLHFSSNSGPLGGYPAFTYTFHASLLRAHRLLRTSSFNICLFLPLVNGRVCSPHSTRMLDTCPKHIIFCTVPFSFAQF